MSVCSQQFIRKFKVINFITGLEQCLCSSFTKTQPSTPPFFNLNETRKSDYQELLSIYECHYSSVMINWQTGCQQYRHMQRSVQYTTVAIGVSCYQALRFYI